ncbi:MAG: 5-(carboxyamino)imidazole ribonucleotide synthase [Gammaproteobacteria bacterium]|nr:5-(carboxyamino)imidazole ribonucleotide synthase [Gammaproteobacteria bacterium]
MRVGIIGAGQLGQMLGIAARDLGIECRFLDPSSEPPAAAYGDLIQRPFDDAGALADIAASCDVVTYEFENVPVVALQRVSDQLLIYPPTEALRQAQDRLDEKRLFEQLGIPLAAFHTVDSREDLDAAASALGLPMVVKTRRLGYDGKGQHVVRDAADNDAAWQALGGQPLIAEQFVPFDFEVSAIGVRATNGETRIYPLSRNVHRHGILHTSCSPVDAPGLGDRATGYVDRLLQHLDYVGVLALEMFVAGDQLLANEFAPRVHNSGHWTIEGAATSQFENHLRAVTGMPLGSTAGRGHAGMLNLIGTIPEAARTLHHGVLHDYGKSPRPGRKLGHITVVADSAAERDEQLDIISEIVTESTPAAGHSA